VDGHGRSTTASVVELRLRLYRPEPPADAVAAYLAALHAEPVLVTGAPMRAPRSPVGHRSWSFTSTVVAACVLGTVVVSTLVGRHAPELVSQPAMRTPASTSSTAARLPAPPLMGVPLGDLFGTGPLTGRFTAKGHHVVASVLCSGVATLAVRIGTEPPTLLSCDAGPAAFAVVASTGPQQHFTISVTPDAPIRWSLAAAAVP
jgi:hypothetical protein